MEVLSNCLENGYNKRKAKRVTQMPSDKMSIKEVQDKIRPIFQEYPIEKAILFGSYAQHYASGNSDIDLFIDTGGRLQGLNFVGLLEELTTALGKNVDLIDKAHIEPGSSILQKIEDMGVVIYMKV
jgi:predicted nucleotidyltransferase